MNPSTFALLVPLRGGHVCTMRLAVLNIPEIAHITWPKELLDYLYIISSILHVSHVIHMIWLWHFNINIRYLILLSRVAIICFKRSLRKLIHRIYTICNSDMANFLRNKHITHHPGALFKHPKTRYQLYPLSRKKKRKPTWPPSFSGPPRYKELRSSMETTKVSHAMILTCWWYHIPSHPQIHVFVPRPKGENIRRRPWPSVHGTDHWPNGWDFWQP